MSQPISVVVPVYDGVTQLDFTQPPFNSGRPDTAPAEVLEAVNARTATSRTQRRVRLDAWAAAHRAGPEA